MKFRILAGVVALSSVAAAVGCSFGPGAYNGPYLDPAPDAGDDGDSGGSTGDDGSASQAGAPSDTGSAGASGSAD